MRSKTLAPIALNVLALLCEAPQHPYELQRTLHQRRKGGSDARLRALYHAVDRLARAALIEPVETSRAGRRPERTVYRITPRGRDEMAVRLIDLLETPPAEAAPFGLALSFLAYVSPRAAVHALQTRALLLEGQIAALDASLQALAGQFRLPRLALVEEEWNRTQRQAERDFTLHLVDAIRDGSVTWDVNWDEIHHSIQPDSPALHPHQETTKLHDHPDRNAIPNDPKSIHERHLHRP